MNTNPNFVTYEKTGYPESTYQTGNTVRMQALFNDWDGLPVAPELVKLVFYTLAMEQLMTLDITTTLPDGSFYHDCQGMREGSYIYEWYAEIGGTPSLQRGRISFKKL